MQFESEVLSKKYSADRFKVWYGVAKLVSLGVSTVFYLYTTQVVLDSDAETRAVSALKALVYFSRLENTNEATGVCSIGIRFAGCKPDLRGFFVWLAGGFS